MDRHKELHEENDQLLARVTTLERELAQVTKERDEALGLISKGAEAMGCIRFLAHTLEINGPQWSEDPGFSVVVNDAALKQSAELTALRARVLQAEELAKALSRYLAYASLDDRPERQMHRSQIKDLLAAWTALAPSPRATPPEGQNDGEARI